MALSSRSKLALIGVGLVGAVLLVSVSALSRPSDDPGATIELSGPMPELEGEALEGEAITPDLYRGKVVVVTFWAAWCAPCRQEQPGLQRLSEEYEGRVSFVGVNHTDDRAAAREYVREFGVTYPSLFDPAGAVAYEFEIPYLPATVLTDASGEMRYRLLGAQPESALRRYVDELLSA